MLRCFACLPCGEDRHGPFYDRGDCGVFYLSNTALFVDSGFSVCGMRIFNNDPGSHFWNDNGFSVKISREC